MQVGKASNEDGDSGEDGGPTGTFSDAPPAETAFVPWPSCKRCGAIFPVTFGAGEGSHVSVEFTCGVCGLVNKSPGTYEATRGDDGRLHMVLYDMTSAELKALRAAVKAAADAEDASVEDVVATVESASPGLAQWLIEWMSKQPNRLEVWAVVQMIFAIIAVALVFKPNTPAPQVNQTIVNVEQGQYAELPLPKHKPCFCGSGRRFNQCHGGRIGDSINPHHD